MNHIGVERPAMTDLSREGQAAHPDVARAEEESARAIQLRIEGYNYREIAKMLGVSLGTAHTRVQAGLEAIREQKLESADELRRLELGRIDMLIMRMVATLPKKEDGGADLTKPVDPALMNSILKAIEARRKLLGIDAPIRWEGSGPGGGPIPIAAGLMDLTKLSVDELRTLEAMILKAGQPALIAPPAPAQAPAQVTAGKPEQDVQVEQNGQIIDPISPPVSASPPAPEGILPDAPTTKNP